MHTIYVIVLIACTAAVLALVLWRLRHLRANPPKGGEPLPSRGRLINEWIWTVVPVAILVALLWRTLPK